MNKEYEIKDDKLVIIDDKGVQTERNITNNFKEILLTENNIEEIENFNNYTNFNEIFNNISKQNLKNLVLITLPISVIIAIILSCIQSIPIYATLLQIPTVVSAITFFVSDRLSMKEAKELFKEIKTKQESIVDDELTTQKEKLNELNKNSIIQKSNNKIEKEKINKSELINNLKRKLELIKEYQLNKDEYLEYSKDHFISIKLKNKGYSESDVEFIQMLIKEDLELEIEHQKTLKLEKKKKI